MVSKDEKRKKKLNDMAYQLIKTKNVNEVKIGTKIIGGEDTGEPCISIGVLSKINAEDLDSNKLIPEKLNNMKTDIVEVEEIWAHSVPNGLKPQQSASEHLKKYRPLQGGISVGNEAISAGTMGWYYVKYNEVFPWSNSHVFFQDPFTDISSQPTKRILQQGTHDGGRYPNNYIGYLRYGFMLNNQANHADRTVSRMLDDGTYSEAAYNTADSALCKLDELTVKDLKKSILNMGNRVPSKTRVAELGETITLSSRSGVLSNPITNLGSVIRVNYGGSRYAIVADCIEIEGPIGYPGSSGGVPLCDSDNAIVGQNFAGSAQKSILCAIQHIDTGFSGHPLFLEDPNPNPDPDPEPPVVEWIDRYKVKLSLGGVVDLEGVIKENVR